MMDSITIPVFFLLTLWTPSFFCMLGEVVLKVVRDVFGNFISLREIAINNCRFCANDFITTHHLRLISNAGFVFPQGSAKWGGTGEMLMPVVTFCLVSTLPNLPCLLSHYSQQSMPNMDLDWLKQTKRAPLSSAIANEVPTWVNTYHRVSAHIDATVLV
jgi:hypothetical protein